MLKRGFFILGAVAVWSNQLAYAEEQLVMVEKFQSGFENVSITKVYDEKANVYCYLYGPQIVSNKLVIGGYAYEGNSVGSISCVNAQPKSTTNRK